MSSATCGVSALCLLSSAKSCYNGRMWKRLWALIFCFSLLISLGMPVPLRTVSQATSTTTNSLQPACCCGTGQCHMPNCPSKAGGAHASGVICPGCAVQSRPTVLTLPPVIKLVFGMSTPRIPSASVERLCPPLPLCARPTYPCVVIPPTKQPPRTV